MNKIFLGFSLILILIGCKKSPISIDRKIFSPDSSYVIIGYYYDYGALGKSPDQLSIIKNGEEIPKSGNFIEDKYAPRMKWISNDSILILCGSDVESIRDWAKPKFKDIVFIYRNDNPPFKLHKKYYFTDYEVLADSLIRFKCGLWNFLYYMKTDDDYTFPIKSLEIISYNNEFDNIQIKDDILFTKEESVTEGRDIVVKYFPKFELIPSLISNEKIKRLERILKKRI